MKRLKHLFTKMMSKSWSMGEFHELVEAALARCPDQTFAQGARLQILANRGFRSIQKRPLTTDLEPGVTKRNRFEADISASDHDDSVTTKPLALEGMHTFKS